MILRLLFALGSVAILGALLYFQDSDNSSGESGAGDYATPNPGFTAVHAQLIETGEDGLPLYRLDAERIEQPQPRGVIWLTDPKLDYQPQAGNHWTLTAQHGQMPQDARTAEPLVKRTCWVACYDPEQKRLEAVRPQPVAHRDEKRTPEAPALMRAQQIDRPKLAGVRFVPRLAVRAARREAGDRAVDLGDVEARAAGS